MPGITIGGLAYDGGNGTPYAPLYPPQLEAWADAAEAYRFRGSPRQDGGEVTAWLDCDQVTGQRRLAEQGGQIGYLVTVAYPHGSIGPIPVANVSGEWLAKAGTVNGGVLVVRVAFNYSKDKNSGEVSRSLVWCETADALAGPWTQRPTWACMGQQDGLGTYLGDSEATAVGEIPDPSLVGKYVRLVRKQDYPTTKTVEWVGEIISASAMGRRDPSTGTGWGARTVYQFAGIGSVLAKLRPMNWRATQEGGAEPGGTPGGDTTQVRWGHSPFNAGGGKDRGGSLVQVDAAPQPTVYLHASGRGGEGSSWTAWDAVRTFLAITRENWSNFPIKLHADDFALLNFSDTWETQGRSVLDFLAQVITPARGITFRLDVTTGESGTAGSGYVTVRIVDLTAAGSEVDLTTDNSKEWASSQDGTETADWWYLDLGQREFLATVDFRGDTTEDGTKGWKAAAETTWDGLAADKRDSANVAAVWRRYVMKRQWTGTTRTAQIPNVRAVDGSGQETGELSGTEPFPDGIFGWRISRTIPAGPGVDLADGAYAKPITPGSPVDGPLVWWFKSPDYDVASLDYQVEVEDQAAAIILGRGGEDAAAIKTKLADGWQIRATLSFLHYLTHRASRKQAGTFPRTDAPRVSVDSVSLAMPRLDVVAGCVVGVNGAGAIEANAGRRDNGPDIAVAADAFKRWRLTNAGSASWSAVTSATLTPICGTMVSGLKVVSNPGPPPTTATIALGGIPVAQRRVSWDLFNQGVTWNASRIAPAISVDGRGGILAQAGGGVRPMAYK